MLRRCIICDEEYNDKHRRGKPGKIIHCEDCAEEEVDKYTGVMVYDHKVAPSIQINSDPRLTEYIIQATKLKNKGSNLGSNLKVSRPLFKSGAAKTITGESNAKGRSDG